jgi:hypothetical protein
MTAKKSKKAPPKTNPEKPKPFFIPKNTTQSSHGHLKPAPKKKHLDQDVNITFQGLKTKSNHPKSIPKYFSLYSKQHFRLSSEGRRGSCEGFSV